VFGSDNLSITPPRTQVSIASDLGRSVEHVLILNLFLDYDSRKDVSIQSWRGRTSCSSRQWANGVR
jgi:hypothetical protein